MTIYALDHLVLTVASIPATEEFYRRALGIAAQVSSKGRHALPLGSQKINLHERGHEFEPKAALPTPGSGDLCLLTETPIDTVLATLRAAGVPTVEGPVRRSGAQGPILSVYIRDPDGNLVEIANLL